MPFLRFFLLLSLLFSFLPTGFAARRTEGKEVAEPVTGRPAVLRLTLRQAIQLAIEENLAIKVEAFGPSIARTRTVEELGRFDPELQGAFEQGMTRTSLGGERRFSSFELGVGGLTPLGTVYNFGLRTDADDYNSFRSGLALGITQPLLRGFGTDVNLAGLRIARVNQEGSEWAFRQQVIEVVTRTIYTYNALYSAQRQLEAAIRSRDAARQLEEDERRRASIGVRIGLDVISARAEASAREEAVLLAQSQINDQERFLKQLITTETRALLDTHLEIAPPPTPMVGEVDLDAGLRDALELRPDFQQAILELTIRDINIVTARNETLPRLDLTASLNLLGFSRSDFHSSLNIFDAASSAPESWGAGLIFRLPIPNRAAKSRHERTRLLKAQALVELHRMEQGIIVEVANAAGHIETARQRVETTREALRLARESLAAGNERLKAGTATAFEVLELQRKETEAEASLIKAEGDYRNAISEYDLRTGTTLVRNRVTIAR
ncbi:MAG TPA: TolC family protein [Chthoniobacteraceae bacterium]|nr:TolC family protein [Chthoniobacteraceae bacterium]